MSAAPAGVVVDLPTLSNITTTGYDAASHTKRVHTSPFPDRTRDPKTGAYALGPRMYDPSINRFVGADHYVGATANMALAADPLTGNRYLYAGANPVGMIDDGHAYLYSSRWHPTRWNVWSWFRGQVSAKFHTWGQWNFGRAAYDTYHHINAKLIGTTFTYIRILDAKWGRNDRKWAGLNHDIRSAQRQAYESAVQQAVNIVQRAFVEYLRSESWRWDISWGDIANVASSLASRLAGCWQGGMNLGAQGTYWGGRLVFWNPAAGATALGATGAVGGCAAGAWTANRMTPGPGPWG